MPRPAVQGSLRHHPLRSGPLRAKSEVRPKAARRRRCSKNLVLQGYLARPEGLEPPALCFEVQVRNRRQLGGMSLDRTASQSVTCRVLNPLREVRRRRAPAGPGAGAEIRRKARTGLAS
jgi:hypothetical protein